MKQITRYRDSKTGRWTSHAKWKRSKVSGGTRYKRVAVKKPAAKKSKRGVRITIGYDSSKQNSWFLTVIINTRKRLKDSQIAEIVAWLAGDGHFDGMKPLDDESDKTPADYQFCTFYNFDMVKERGIKIKPGHAILYSWYRNEAFL